MEPRRNPTWDWHFAGGGAVAVYDLAWPGAEQMIAVRVRATTAQLFPGGPGPPLTVRPGAYRAYQASTHRGIVEDFSLPWIAGEAAEHTAARIEQEIYKRVPTVAHLHRGLVGSRSPEEEMRERRAAKGVAAAAPPRPTLPDWFTHWTPPDQGVELEFADDDRDLIVEAVEMLWEHARDVWEHNEHTYLARVLTGAKLYQRDAVLAADEMEAMLADVYEQRGAGDVLVSRLQWAIESDKSGLGAAELLRTSGRPVGWSAAYDFAKKTAREYADNEANRDAATVYATDYEVEDALKEKYGCEVEVLTVATAGDAIAVGPGDAEVEANAPDTDDYINITGGKYGGGDTSGHEAYIELEYFIEAVHSATQHEYPDVPFTEDDAEKAIREELDVRDGKNSFHWSSDSVNTDYYFRPQGYPLRIVNAKFNVPPGNVFVEMLPAPEEPDPAKAITKARKLAKMINTGFDDTVLGETWIIDPSDANKLPFVMAGDPGSQQIRLLLEEVRGGIYTVEDDSDYT